MYREIYLDNAATTKPYNEVIETMRKVALENYGNPSSMHLLGIESERLIKKSRETVSQILSAETKEIIFTSGGTESNNLAINGYLEANPRKGKHILTTRIEHPSILEVFKSLSHKGYTVEYISVDNNGIINLEELKDKIKTDTALLSIIYINNEVGSMQPLDEIIRIRNMTNPDTVIHLDAVQAFGKLRLQPGKAGVGMLSVSSHKIHGPKGIGCLYVNKNVKIKPLFYGGGQEALLRSGTENVPGISAFGQACEIKTSSMDNDMTKVAVLRSLMINELKNCSFDYTLNSPENSLPYILNVSFNDLRAEVLLHHLEEKKIFVSTGSACSSRKNVHSHVLLAMGKKAADIDGAIRFSFSFLNNDEDIYKTIEALNDIIPRIRIKKNKSIK